MNKVISLFVVLLTMSIFAEEIAIPQWLGKQTQETYARFQEWKGEDDVVLFPIITDVHSGGRDSYTQVAYLNEVAKTFEFDFIADLGDIGLDVPATKDPEEARKFIARHSELHQQFPGIFVNLVGNHDHNRIAGEDKFDDKFLAEYFTKPSLAKADGNLVLAENATYGYIDIPARKTRVFFLNTCDRDTDGYYVVAPKQMQFLADNLESIEPDWHAFILSHYCMRPLGHWVSETTSCCKNEDIFLRIIRDCNAKVSGELKGVKWDFSKGNPMHVVSYLTGDSHFDATEVYEGIFVAITQGYGGVGNADMPVWSSKVNFDYHQSMLLDIVAYKPATHQLKLFRLGAGGAERDRAFQW